ncbi:hypothetical protein [Ornithinimicrobium murale]|uniref:hypothetical protein n=1 Tax=Ornithinimicrobium murale TaxID=1050153 RepID=UPI000E0DC695|nr:hypothetical protein [Ornithinimicrobium murale]
MSTYRDDNSEHPNSDDTEAFDNGAVDSSNHDSATGHETTRSFDSSDFDSASGHETTRSFDSGRQTAWPAEEDRLGPTEEPRTLPRPKGPSWSTIALGLVCLVVAGGALVVEFTEVSLEWDRTGPLALIGLGVLLVLVGLAALVRRGDDDPELDR